MKSNRLQINKMCLAAMFIALGWLLPFITGQIQQVGNMLCPMHLPVLIAGFVLGPWYGCVIGMVIPLSRSLIFGMPPLYPIGFAMMFELAMYGFVSGFLFKLLKTKTKWSDLSIIYISLITAMILGRGIWGITRTICGLFPNSSFTWKAFMSGAFLTAWPGILLQLILIPLLIFTLNKARLLNRYMDFKNDEITKID